MFDSLKKKLREGVQKLSGPAAGAPPREEKPATRPSRKEAPRPARKPAEKAAKKETARKARPKEPQISVKEVTKPAPELMPSSDVPVAREPLTEKPSPETPVPAAREPVTEEAPVEEKPAGRFARLRGIRDRVSTRELTEKDIDDFFEDSETELLQSNVAMSVIDQMKTNLKSELAGKPIPRRGAKEFIVQGFEKSLVSILDQGTIDIEKVIKTARSEGRPAVFVFLGFNGVGKTSTIAKLAHKLKHRGYSIVFAASDTFRTAAQEQLEVHGNNLDIKVIKHGYGSDPAAVLFDAIRYAKSNKCDVVMADTAGRMHTDVNLADELKKICRVNNPDLKVLVLDSLTGNDIVPQGEMFNKMVDVDGVVLTKVDVDKKGGAIISAAFVLKKPILYITTGQGYDDIEDYRPKKIVNVLLG